MARALIFTPDDFNKLCAFFRTSEPRDGKLVRDVNTNYFNQNDFGAVAGH